MRDSYRAKHLKEAREEMERDEGFIPKVCCVKGRYINLDEGALDLLVDYYEGKDKKND